ncbi:MAG: hypothetical protein RR922_03065 [Clostridia bacterium]
MNEKTQKKGLIILTIMFLSMLVIPTIIFTANKLVAKDSNKKDTTECSIVEDRTIELASLEAVEVNSFKAVNPEDARYSPVAYYILGAAVIVFVVKSVYEMKETK